MPAKSQAQQRLFAIAANAPEELYKRNKLLSNLPQNTLRKFAATKRTGLPVKVKATKVVKAPPKLGQPPKPPKIQMFG